MFPLAHRAEPVNRKNPNLHSFYIRSEDGSYRLRIVVSPNDSASE